MSIWVLFIPRVFRVKDNYFYLPSNLINSPTTFHHCIRLIYPLKEYIIYAYIKPQQKFKKVTVLSFLKMIILMSWVTDRYLINIMHSFYLGRLKYNFQLKDYMKEFLKKNKTGIKCQMNRINSQTSDESF